MPDEDEDAWWKDATAKRAADAQAARARIAALGDEESLDPYRSSAQQQVRQEALGAAPESFYGYTPGWDFGDLLHNPVTDAALRGLGGAINVIDTGGRFGRSLVDETADLVTGQFDKVDASRPFRSLYDVEAAPTMTDIRRRFLFKDIGREGDGVSWGDVPDVAGDFVAGMVTDPLTYALAGMTRAGGATLQGGRALVGALSKAGRLAPSAIKAAELADFAGVPLKSIAEQGLMAGSREAAEQAALRAFETGGKTVTKTGADGLKSFLPEFGTGTAPRPTFTGLQPNLYQQLGAGERSLEFGIPLTPLTTGPLTGPASPLWAQKVGNTIAAIGDYPRLGVGALMENIPGARRLGDLAFAAPYRAVTATADALAKSKFGRATGNRIQAIADAFLEPGVLHAGGRLAAQAEEYSNTVGMAFNKHLFDMNEIAAKAKLTQEERVLAEKLHAAYEPTTELPVIRDWAIEDAHTEAGKRTLKQEYDEAFGKVALLDKEKQNAIWSISQNLHRFDQTANKALIDSGLGASQLGDGLRAQRDRYSQQLRMTKEEFDANELRFTGAIADSPVQWQHAEQLRTHAPDAFAAREQAVNNLRRTLVADFRTAEQAGRNVVKEGDAVVALFDTLDRTLSTAHDELGYFWKRFKIGDTPLTEDEIQGTLRQMLKDDPELSKITGELNNARIDNDSIAARIAAEPPSTPEAMARAQAEMKPLKPFEDAIAARQKVIEFQARNPRGSFNEMPDGTRLIRIFREGGADLSTPIHEVAHVAATMLPEAEQALVFGYMKKLGHDTSLGWNPAMQEQYAKDLERYMRTGKAPIKELDGVFAKLKEWLKEIYAYLKEALGGKMSPEIRQHFDRLLGGTDDAGRGFAKSTDGLPDQTGTGRPGAPIPPRFTREQIKAMPVLKGQVITDHLNQMADVRGWPRLPDQVEGKVQTSEKISEISMGVMRPNVHRPEQVADLAARNVDSIFHEWAHLIDMQTGLVNKGVRGPSAGKTPSKAAGIDSDFLSEQGALSYPAPLPRASIRPELADKFDALQEAMDGARQWSGRLVDQDDFVKQSYLSTNQEMFARALELGFRDDPVIGALIRDRHKGLEYPQGKEADKVAKAAKEFLDELKPYKREIDERVYRGGGNYETVTKTVQGLHKKPTGDAVFDEAFLPENADAYGQAVASKMGWHPKASRFEDSISHGDASVLPKNIEGAYTPKGGVARAKNARAMSHELYGHGLDHHMGEVAGFNRGPAVTGKAPLPEDMSQSLSNRLDRYVRALDNGDPQPVGLNGLRPEVRERAIALWKAIQEAEGSGVSKRLDVNKLGGDYYGKPEEKFSRAIELGLANNAKTREAFELAQYAAEKRMTTSNSWGEEYWPHDARQKVAKAASEFLDSLKSYKRKVDGKTVHGLHQPGVADPFRTRRQKVYEGRRAQIQEKLEATENMLRMYEKKVASIPNYSPTILSESARQALAERTTGRAPSGEPSLGQHEKGFAFKRGEGLGKELDLEQVKALGIDQGLAKRVSEDLAEGYTARAARKLADANILEADRERVLRALRPDPLEDVPMRPSEIEETFARGGTGTAATAGRGKLDPAFPITDVMKSAFQEKALEKLQKEAAFLAKMDPLESRAHKAYNVVQTVNKAQLRQKFDDVYKSTPVRAFDNVKAWARDGVPLDEIEKRFNRYGFNRLEFMVDPAIWRSLKEGRIDVKDAFKPGAVPFGTREMPDWSPVAKLDANERIPNPIDGVMPKEARYVSEPALKELEKQMAIHNDMGAVLGAIAPAMQTVLSIYKPMSTVVSIKYHLRNFLSDTFRMMQEGLWGGASTANDLKQLLNPRAWANYTSTGLNRMAPFRTMRFDLGAGAQQFGKQVIDGEELMNLLAQKGVLNSGLDAGDMLRSIRPDKSSSAAGTDFWAQSKRALSYRDEAMRTAAFLTAIRKGKSIDDAVLDTTRALFDYKRLSPAMDFLRKTGIAPFIGWSAKNIPAQIEFAMKHPGVVAAVFRAMEMAKDGEIPPDGLPKYMSQKFNIHIANRKNPVTGRDEQVIVNAGSIIPIGDLYDAVKDPQMFVRGQLAPWSKAGLEWVVDGDFKEGLARGVLGVPGNVGGKIYDAATGKILPGGEKAGFGRAAESYISPVTRTVVDERGAIRKAAALAEKELRVARLDWIRAQASYNQNVTLHGAEDPGVQASRRDLDMAKRAYFQAKAIAERKVTQAAAVLATP